MRDFKKYFFLSIIIGCATFLSISVFAQEKAKSTEQKDEAMTNVIADVEETAAEIEKKRSTGLKLHERINAVSRKVFLKKGRFEIEPVLAGSVNDAFFLRAMGGLRGSYHLSEEWSLELGGLGTIYPIPLPAIRTVREDVAKPVDDFPIWALVDLGATFSPIYGKFALFSEYAVHFDTFINFGVAGVFDGSNSSFFTKDQPLVSLGGAANLNVSPAAQIGLGTRIILNKWVTIRVDLKNYIFPSFGNTVFPPRKLKHLPFRHLAMLNVGLGFYFPMDFDYEYEGTKVVK